MKLKTPSLLTCLLGTALSAHAEFVLAPNGDFSIAGGASWTAGDGETNDSGGASSVFSFPDSGGNSGGFAQMNLADGSFAVIFSEVTLDSLSLIPGEAYDFKMDMKNLDGPGTVGKLKIEFPNDGVPGNIAEFVKVADLIDGGGSWQTYTFTGVPIPPGATTMKFVPLLDAVANVGFDNVGVDNTPVVVDPPPVGDFLVPNGDFESGGEFWSEATNGPTGFSYPASGGSPSGDGGFAAIDFTTGDYAVIFNDPTLLSTFGLIAGETYVFTADMINLDGPGNVGKLKIEFPGASPDNFGDMPVDALKGDGSTWQTYEWTITIPVDATTIKFVPVLAVGDNNLNIGYDNIGGSNIPVEPPPFVPEQIPNPGFELDPIGVNWATTQTTPTYVDDNTGNPGRFVQLSDGVGDFVVLYAFNGAEVTFASLGLAPGDSYTIQMDMKIITPGTDPTSPIGGLRLQGPEAFVQEYYPAVIGTGTEWETYTFDLIAPPVASTAIGLRPGKSGGGATVAFDNVQINVAPQAPFAAAIETGTVVSWEPSGADFTYQAQKSPDGDNWTDFGPLIFGDAVNSAFDEAGAAFYQVIESALEAFELVADPGFEEGSEANPSGSWGFLGSDAPVVVDDSGAAHGGNNFVRMAVDNGAAELPKTSILQQFGIGILPEDVLDFSFWVNVEVNNSANLTYSIKWRDITGAVIGQRDGSMNSVPVGSGWTEVSVTGLMPPASTDTALIEFGCVTGAVADQAGSILIDDVSLIVPLAEGSEVIPATSGAGVQVSWPSKSGSSYQPMSSSTLGSFVDFGPAITGDGGVQSIQDVLAPPTKFYMITETP